MNDNWEQARLALEARIKEHPLFVRLVKGYGGNPDSKVPSRRAGRLATRICEGLGIDPAIYRGNVFGAAADVLRQRAF
jgi:hypothetical protein